ncbi:MAG: hypothetical protein WKG00_24445 [Polyangiaceae bacterium]
MVERCLRKDPAQRFQNAGDLAIALLPFAPRRARAGGARRRRHARRRPAHRAARFLGYGDPRAAAALDPAAAGDHPGVARRWRPALQHPGRDPAGAGQRAGSAGCPVPRHWRRAGAALGIAAALATAVAVGGRLDDGPQQPIQVVVGSGPADTVVAPARGGDGVPRASIGVRAAVHGRAPRPHPGPAETAPAVAAGARPASLERRPKGDIEARPRGGDVPRTPAAPRAMPSDIILRR